MISSTISDVLDYHYFFCYYCCFYFCLGCCYLD